MKTPFLKSFVFAAQGVAKAAGGRNFKVQFGFAVAAVALGIVFNLSVPEWLAVFVCIGLVLGGECMNTAIEALCDVVCPQQHPLVARAKDCAAGAVLLASAASLCVGAMLFVPRLIACLT